MSERNSNLLENLDKPKGLKVAKEDKRSIGSIGLMVYRLDGQYAQ